MEHLDEYLRGGAIAAALIGILYLIAGDSLTYAHATLMTHELRLKNSELDYENRGLRKELELKVELAKLSSHHRPRLKSAGGPDAQPVPVGFEQKPVTPARDLESDKEAWKEALKLEAEEQIIACEKKTAVSQHKLWQCRRDLKRCESACPPVYLYR